MTQRSAGVLAHPTSIPGPDGIGDLGPGALRFLDWMVRSGLSVWQFLPVGPTGLGHSPYTALSSHAGNPLLISPEPLRAAGWLPPSSRSPRDEESPGRVEFARVARRKQRWLRQAYTGFLRKNDPEDRGRLERFVDHDEQRDWLQDWARFAALRRHHRGRPWTRWDAELRRRETTALAAADRELADSMAFHRFVQFVFAEQWSGFRSAASARGLRLMGDLPIYVATDSVDVWAAQDGFLLDADGRPRVVAGCPPDYFSSTGQRWGNPLYDWPRMREDGFGWWISRIRAALGRVDLLRLDHFRGFVAYWEIDAARRTAREGRWMPGPGEELFLALQAALGRLPLVAEDLGVITDDVRALRDRLGLPGMRVIQFAFGDSESEHLPEHHGTDVVAYTGTHDNDTTAGWFAELPEPTRRRVLDYLGVAPDRVVVGMIDAVLRSPAALAVIPLQDLLGLGSAARMNHPGTARGNWDWRAEAGALGSEAPGNLRLRIETSDRGQP